MLFTEDATQEHIADIPIEKLALTQEVFNILRNAKIKTVWEIIALEKERRLLRVRNLGRKHYEAIKDAFAGLGYSLDGSPLEERLSAGGH